MPANRKFIASWTAGVIFLLLLFYAATSTLWLAARASAAAALEKQVGAVLAGDIAEGNLFKLGASLTRLMHSGSLDYAEIRAYSLGRGWERVFRTSGSEENTDIIFSDYSCG